MENRDYEAILNEYWNVIEACLEIQKDYAGKSVFTRPDLRGKIRICPDSVGNMLNQLTKARKKFPIKRELVECQQ